MKKISDLIRIIAVTALCCLPTGHATAGLPSWQQQPQTHRKALFEKRSRPVDSSYLAGAVPLEDGKVVFRLTLDLPGMSREAVYARVLDWMTRFAQNGEEADDRRVALTDAAKGQVAGRFTEWLYFKDTRWQTDRTRFRYALIADCLDGGVSLVLTRISYAYEMDRRPAGGLQVTAEEWITDEAALNKKKTRLNRISGKFRRKTIDRKNEIFDSFTNALKH